MAQACSMTHTTSHSLTALPVKFFPITAALINSLTQVHTHKPTRLFHLMMRDITVQYSIKSVMCLLMTFLKSAFESSFHMRLTGVGSRYGNVI